MSDISILILYGFLIVIFYLILHQTNGNREASISTSTQSVQRRIIRCIRIDSGNVTNIVGVLEERDRQGNIYTIHDESSRQQNRYNGVYCLESTVANAARLQAQREKDDKDLPSYEEVMRLSIATAAAESGSAVRNLPSALPPAPPYNEINLNPSGGENDNAASCSATAAPTATLSLAARNITNPVVVTMANTTTPTTTTNSTSTSLTTSVHNV